METRQIIAVLFVSMATRNYIKIKWNIFQGSKFRFKVNVLFFVFYCHKNNYKLFRLLISCFLLFSLLPQCFNWFILWPSLGVQSVWKMWLFLLRKCRPKQKEINGHPLCHFSQFHVTQVILYLISIFGGLYLRISHRIKTNWKSYSTTYFAPCCKHVWEKG